MAIILLLSIGDLSECRSVRVLQSSDSSDRLNPLSHLRHNKLREYILKLQVTVVMIVAGGFQKYGSLNHGSIKVSKSWVSHMISTYAL